MRTLKTQYCVWSVDE